MKQFKDTTGRTWTIAVNVDSIKRVRALVKDSSGEPINLLAAVEGKLLVTLVDDPILIVDVVYALCQPEAAALKVSEEDFGRAMAGDAIDAATVALMEDLSDFFPASRRPLLQTSLKKLAHFRQIATEEGLRRLESPHLEQNLRRQIASDLSGDSPESSD